jgi:hypothetical protein
MDFIHFSPKILFLVAKFSSYLGKAKSVLDYKSYQLVVVDQKMPPKMYRFSIRIVLTLLIYSEIEDTVKVIFY